MSGRSTSRRAANSEGSVVLLTLVILSMLVAVGVSLGTLATTEGTIASNFEAGQHAFYGAESVIELAMSELANRGDWAPALAGSDHSAFCDGSLQPATPWRTTLDLVQRTMDLQRQTDLAYLNGADTPRWQLYAWGPMDHLVGPTRAPLMYLVAWIADDPSDGDGDPAAETNGVVMLRAESHSIGGLKRTIQVVLKRRIDDSSVTKPTPAGKRTPTPNGPILARFLPVTNSPAPAGTLGVMVLSWRELR